jgi:deoxyadenosine/deoxycytidine kinase
MPEINFLAIEGNIGAGKTSLAKILSERMQAKLVLEEVEENPFLKEFYKDKKRWAFQTQIYFLFSRYRQQQELSTRDLFQKKVACDYCFDKDKIFASINLNEKELFLYQKISAYLEKELPKPDLVIYLQATVPVLLKRITSRGRSYEKEIEPEYIQALNEAYNYYFFHYDKTPLLVINTDPIDFVHNPSHLEELITLLQKPFFGTKYYVPFSQK